MGQYELVSDSDVASLADAVVSVLDTVGVLCQNEDILDYLARFGATIDRSQGVARFPRRLTESFVQQLRKEGTAPCTEGPRTFPKVGMPGLGTQVAQFVYDYRKREKRAGNARDFREMVKFGDVLDDGRVGHCLLLTEVPAILEPLEAAMILAEHARRPGPPFAWDVRQVDYLIEMGDILGIKDWFTWGACCFAHPLRFDKEVADRLIRLVREGQSAGLTAMPVAGATTPATTAGFIVVASAEILATWMAGRSINPEAPLRGSMWGGAMNMKTGSISYSSFDAMRNALAAVEFIRKWTGMTVPVGGGEYADAKVPGYYAATEKAYKAMTIAAFTGRHPDIGEGMLEQGKTLSPVQLLLERELSVGAQLWARKVQVTPQAIALDTIIDVGFGRVKNYVESDHTLAHFREDAWITETMDQSGFAGPEFEQAVLDRLQDKVDAMIASHRKPQVDPRKLAKMRNVVERARRELLG